MTTHAQEIHNMRLISHDRLNGFGNIGEGVHLYQDRSSRRILYMAHESAPKDITGVDVTDIANPKVIVQTDLDYPHLRSNSLSIVDDIMLVAYQSQQPGQSGARAWASTTSATWRSRGASGSSTQAGPYSRGCHVLWWVDGDYAHLSTGAADFQPRDQKDDQLYMIVDVSDPTSPKEAGRWWLPGTREGDDAPPPRRNPYFDAGHRLHNANVYPERPDRAYCAWIDGGTNILDISDVANPSVRSANSTLRPTSPASRTRRMPLFGRDLMVVTQESVRTGGEDHPKLVWMVDIKDETNPVIISTFPTPDLEDYFGRPGRYGAHNIYENQPGPTCYKSETLIYGTFFNGGIRVYDTTNPFRPEEVAYFVPQVPEGATANGINDVFIDENGILYVVDRLQGGLYILELTI